jgi:hypothetical protein
MAASSCGERRAGPRPFPGTEARLGDWPSLRHDATGDDIMARTLWTAALILGFVLAMSMTRRRPQ